MSYDSNQERSPKHMRALTPRFTTKGITGTQLAGGVITGKENNPKLTGLNWVQAICLSLSRLDIDTLRRSIESAPIKRVRSKYGLTAMPIESLALITVG